jgi:hypothetical protein
MALFALALRSPQVSGYGAQHIRFPVMLCGDRNPLCGPSKNMQDFVSDFYKLRST